MTRTNGQWRLKSRPVGLVKTTDFEHVEDRPCESLLSMRRVRATILEQLGRGEEAGEARAAAAVAPAPYPATIYDSFHGKLDKLRPERDGGAKR